jgi:mono/diheme cytochrome c family protein
MRGAGCVLILVLCAAAWAGEDWKAPAAAKSLKNPVPMAEGAKAGRALFQDNCVICHGTTGKGDGQAAAAMNPKPRSLVSRPVQAQTDGELFWKITEGRAAMPSWKALPEKDRWSLVDHLRGLAGRK